MASTGSRARILGRVAAALGVGATFVASLVGGAYLHLDAAVTRRVVRTTVERVLDDRLAGEFEVGEVEILDDETIVLGRFAAFDPAGRQVVQAERIRLRGPWLRNVVAHVLAPGAELYLPDVRIERGEVALFLDGDAVSLARTFAPVAEPDLPAEPPPREAPPPFAVVIRRIEIGSLDVQGTITPSVTIDAVTNRMAASLRAGNRGLSLHLARSAVEERALLGAITSGTVDFHLELVTEHAREPRVSLGSSFSGYVGKLQLTTEARLEDGEITVVTDLPHVGPEELRPWLPTSPLGRSVAARAALTGKLPRLGLRGEVLIPAIADEPPGKLAMEGSLSLEDEVMIDAVVEAADLDARLFDATAPRTQLSARVEVSGRLAGSESELLARLHTSRSEVAGEVVPPLEGIAEIAQSGIRTYLVAREPGLSLDAGLTYLPDAPTEVAFRGEGSDLSAVPRLGQLLPGGARGRARFSGQGSLAPDRLDVTVEAEARGVRLPASSFRVGSAAVRARLHGAPDALAIEAHGQGTGLAVEGQEAETFRIDVTGPVTQPTVRARARDRDRREIDARAVIDPKRGEARAIAVTIERDGESLRGTVRRVASRGGRLAVEGVVLEGLGGGLTGDLRVVGGELEGSLEGEDLALDPLFRLAGIRLPYALRGRGDVSLELEPTPEGRRGSLRVAVDDVRMLHFGGDAELLASFDGKTVRPQLVVRLEGNFRDDDDPCKNFGTLVLAGEAELAGALLDPTSWLKATGEGAAHVASLDLRCMKEEWPFLPIGELAGEVTASVQIALDPEARWPTIPAFALRTRDLVVASRAKKDAPPPWRSDRLDLAAGGSFDGVSGETTVDLSLLEARDPRPEPLPLAVGRARFDLDLAAIDEGGAAADASLEAMPWALSLHTGRQPIARLGALPDPWGGEIGGVEGDFQLDVEVDGSPRDPAVAVRLRGFDLAPIQGVTGWDLRTDVDLLGSYHGDLGRLDGTIARQGRTVATLAGELRGDLGERLFGGFDERWTGWIEAKLRSLPLESLPLGEPGIVRGAVSGHVRVDGLGKRPVIDVALDVPELRVGPQVVFDHAVLRVRPEEDRPGVVTVEAALPLRGSQSQGLLASAFATVRWQDELFPRPDGEEPAGLVLVFSDFPLAVIEPFAGASVGQLGGNLDGKVALTLYPESEAQPVALDVDLVLEEGLAQLPGIEISDVEARVTSRPGLIEVPRLAASIQSGRVTGELSCRLRGLTPIDLHGTFAVPEDHRIPLSLDGVPLGSVDGQVKVSLLRTENDGGSYDNLVRIESPHLHLELPAAAGKELQPLEDHPDVTISHAIREPEPEAPPDDGSRTTLLVRLDDVEVQGGTEVRFKLMTAPDDPPKIVLGGPATGSILLTGGELHLFGKTFNVDRGVVRLLPEEVDNPHVNMTAHWNAPDGTIIFVDYIGQLNPITADKIRFRSSPPRGPQEIVSLLLLGEAPQGELAATEEGDRAGSLGQGIAAAQMTALLGQVAPGLSTSFGTNDEGYVATTVTYQFSDEITGSATFEQASGDQVRQRQNEDPRTTFSVDWRFAPNWLLRGSLGVGEGASSGLDLLFQYRY